MQYLAACHHYLELRAGIKQVHHVHRRAGHLLKVVQQEQHLLLSQVLPETFQKGLARPFPDAQRFGDGRHNQRGVTDGGQIHEKHAIGEHITQLRCHLQGQTSFTRAARTC